MNKTILCMIIIAFVTISGITVYKIEHDIPSDDSCVDFKCVSCNQPYACGNYNTIEKIRYVWKLY